MHITRCSDADANTSATSHHVSPPPSQIGDDLRVLHGSDGPGGSGYVHFRIHRNGIAFYANVADTSQLHQRLQQAEPHDVAQSLKCAHRRTNM
ncbi:unnamed protein product, partial [Prorocentrum cordatum]